MRTTESILESLRAAGVRPTAARIAIMQVLESSAPRSISIDAIYQRLIERGTKSPVGTIYLAAREMAARGLILREWGYGHRKMMYRFKPKDLGQAARFRLVCRTSGRIVEINDAELHAQMLQSARDSGICLEGLVLNVVVDHLKTWHSDDASPPVHGAQSSLRSLHS
ncbi:Fur family transcriptional regulator [Ottowia thiooxydans]|uniref:Fur family transcriptional regulator n=1 Tax=Ottowia thiooxydans TaxID=219182 RepID=UPI00048EAF67|nr:transcriptional repressor [Ottowia thiooxydans]